jgi:hypothetical protein
VVFVSVKSSSPGYELSFKKKKKKKKKEKKKRKDDRDSFEVVCVHPIEEKRKRREGGSIDPSV